jgi:ankyrin repeat protein
MSEPLTNRLFDACREGDIRSIIELLEQFGASNSVDYTVGSDSSGRTMLMHACEAPDTGAAWLLLERGAELEHRDSLGKTPMFIAATKGRDDLIRLFAERGGMVDSRDRDQWTPMIAAAWNGRSDAIAALIEHGADVNAVDDQRMSAIMYAALAGHSESVDLLIDSGADCSLVSNDGTTALMYAAMSAKDRIVRSVVSRLDCANDLSVSDKFGNRAIHHAVSADPKEGKALSIAFFLELGEDPDGKLPDGTAYADYLKGDPECLSVLQVFRNRRALQGVFPACSRDGASLKP